MEYRYACPPDRGRAASSPFRAPGAEGRVRDAERLAREARDLAAGHGSGSLDAKAAAHRAREAMAEAQSTLAVLEALRERLITAADAAAEIVRQHEGEAA